MADAPVLPEHRRAAAEALLGVADFHRLERQLPEVFKPWLNTGDVTMLARVFINGRSDDMVNTAQAIAYAGARVLRDCVAAAEELRARRGTVTQLECLQASAIAALTNQFNAAAEKARTNG